VTVSGNDAGSAKPTVCCDDCGATIGSGQRYCLECGSRNGPLSAVVAGRVAALKERGRGEDAGGSAAPADPAAGNDGDKKNDRWDFMPSPQVAAVAVMALLAAGVVLGSVTNPLAQGAGAASIILEEMGGSEAPESEPETASIAPSPAPEATAFESTAEAPPAAPLEEEAPEAEPAPAANPVPFDPEEGEEPLPEIKHVFLIVLDGHGYEEAFGKESPAPYLSETLAGEGKLLPNYYAIAQGGLANEIALLSGQGPTPQTALSCPESTPVAPGTVSVEGQVEGEGCVYPAETKTLPGQLSEAKLTWKAYVEPEPVAAWRKPFAYFAALGEDPEAAQHEGGLDQLATDLKDPKGTPSFSYIVSNACHDGSETPCAPEQPAGLGPVQGFLETVVPEITASPAYQSEGGLIAITFDQAPQAEPEPDTSSCCATPEYPNLPAPAAPTAAEPPASGPVKPTGGGGRVGMLLISPYLAPGTVEESTYYNHFSFLRSVEELFDLEPLGYAAEPALTGFEASLFDASPEGSTVAERPAVKRRYPGSPASPPAKRSR
jgi:hypothetical protein